MAPTVTIKTPRQPGGDVFILTETVTLDSSYPNPAGYVFTPASFNLTYIRRINNIEPTTLAAAATWVYWINPTYATDGSLASFALHLAVVSTGVEVANAVNVSTASFQFIIEGY